MKNTLLIIIISLFSINALAQINASGGLDEKLSFGLKLGIGGSIVSFNDSRNNNIAANGAGHASLFLNKPIAEKFALQAGLSYSDRGYYIAEETFFTFTGSSYRMFYIDLPINAVLKLPLGNGKVLLGGGPYVGYAFGGKVQVNRIDFTSSSPEKQENRNLSYGNKSTDDFKKTDLGFNFLTGYQFKKGWLLNINYSQGVQNILPKEQTANGEKAINAAFHFCVGYEF
jgi:hypothetical protein